MKKINKWSVRDVITTVLLSAVLIVIQLVVNMVCMANDFVSMVLSVGITMFLCAPVYMLMVSRIGKRFVTLIYMTILGVIFLLMGNWFLLPYYVLVGILCEAILWKEGSCQKPKRLTAAWTVGQACCTTGSICCPSGSSGTPTTILRWQAAWSRAISIPMCVTTPLPAGWPLFCCSRR